MNNNEKMSPFCLFKKHYLCKKSFIKKYDKKNCTHC